MAIVVKHQGNPGIDAVAAYGGGNGKRRAQDRSQASSAMTQEMLQSHAMAQRSHDMQVANAARADAIKPRAENGAAAAGGNVNPQGIDASAVDPPVAAGLGTQKAANMPDYAKAQMDKNEYDYKQNMDRKKFDYQLTAKQKAEFDGYNEAYENARLSGDFTEDELKEIRRQAVAKQAGIQPLPRPQEQEATPWADAQKRMFVDPDTGDKGYIDKDGIPQFYKKETTPKDNEAF